MKLGVKTLFKRKNEALFVIAGLVLLCIVGYVFFESLMFLAKSLDIALGQGESEGTVQGFNLSGLKEFGINAAKNVTPSPEANIETPLAATGTAQ